MPSRERGPNGPARSLPVAIATRIRMERARLRLTQEELAHRSGLSRVHIGAIERGEVSCSVTVLAQIAKALQMSARDLLPD